jgi:TRAP-type mannitol/chloroaromatic compound transport system permease large subunit
MSLGVFDASNLGAPIQRYAGLMVNEVLVAVPLFIFMGVVLERSGIAEQLSRTRQREFQLATSHAPRGRSLSELDWTCF